MEEKAKVNRRRTARWVELGLSVARTKPLLVAALLALLVPLQALAQAYLTDGTKGITGGVNNPASTTYSNPNDGVCVVGVTAAGNLLVDKTVTNYQDCQVYTTGLTLMTTSAQCTTAGGAGNDGAKHKWSTNLCAIGGVPKSRAYLDVQDNMCIALGGVMEGAGVGHCVAYGWTYMNSKTGEAIPYRSTLPSPPTSSYTGRPDADKLGFCYASMRMTTAFSTGMALPVTANSCPAIHNAGIVTSGGGTTTGTILVGTPTTLTLSNALSLSIAAGWTVTIAGAGTGGVPFTTTVTAVVTPGTVFTLAAPAPTAVSGATVVAYAVAAEWPLGTDGMPYQTKASYDAGLGWGWTSPNCTYSYGRNGYAQSAITRVDGTVFAAVNAAADMTAFTTQGACLANGGSWDAWLPYNSANLAPPGATTPTVATTPSSSTIVKLDAVTPVLTPGGGDFYTGTGSVCQKCHTDQSRATIERWKPGWVLTAHKTAGDDPTFQTKIAPIWGIKGVQCEVCHATGKPALQDVGTIVYPNTTGPNSGLPRGASGHNQTEYGSHLTGVCYRCHGAPAGGNRTTGTGNPAAIIPTSGGEFALTDMNLAPIVNQFLASSHAKYGHGTNPPVEATSRTVDVITRTNYGSTFEGWVCRTSATVGSGTIITTYVKAGVPTKIPNVDSAINLPCTAAPPAGAGGFWIRDGEAGGTTNGVPWVSSDQGNCMTCHDIHWSGADTNTYGPYVPEPFRRECTTCHVNSGASASGAPQIDLSLINHLSGPGTPLAGTADEACETCHMPKLTSGGSPMHLWSISTNAAYRTAGASTANADVDGDIKVDIVAACGQCHTSGPGPTYSTATLAGAAVGMHDSAGVTYQVTFNTNLSGLTVTANPYVNCGGPCPALTYDWNWGDLSLNGSGNPGIHTYAAGGTYPITLTVNQGGKSVGSVKRNVTLATVDAPPVANGTLTWTPNTWTASLLDTSTDTDGTPVINVVVDWGDGFVKSVGAKGGTFNHTYVVPGTYTIVQTALDAVPQAGTKVYAPVTAGSFTISGTVVDNASAPLNGATVTVYRMSGVVKVFFKTLTTGGGNAFSTGSLAPGTYVLKPSKSGYTFPAIAPVIVGPNSPSNVLTAN